MLAAIRVAHDKKMRVLALTGKGGGKLPEYLQAEDVHVCVPAEVTSHIQESHIMILHCWCEMIDA